jgi:hypothetical protein
LIDYSYSVPAAGRRAAMPKWSRFRVAAEVRLRRQREGQGQKVRSVTVLVSNLPCDLHRLAEPCILALFRALSALHLSILRMDQFYYQTLFRSITRRGQ